MPNDTILKFTYSVWVLGKWKSSGTAPKIGEHMMLSFKVDICDLKIAMMSSDSTINGGALDIA